MDEWDTFWAHGWAGQMDSSDFYTARPHGPNYYPCNWLWKSMAIYWDGKVPSCCADFGEDQIMGNLADESLLEIWNNPAYREIRSAHATGKLDNYKLCRGCDAIWQEGGSAWNLFAGARAVVTGIRCQFCSPGPTARTQPTGPRRRAANRLAGRHAPPDGFAGCRCLLPCPVLASERCASPLYRTSFRRRLAGPRRTSTTLR